MRDEIIEFMKQPPVIAALIALFGAAVIVPLVTKFYLATRSRLRVEVRAFRANTSEGVKKIVRDALGAQQQFFAPMYSVVGYHGYAVVTITNMSKKKIANVSAVSPAFALIWQLDDAAEAVELQPGQPIVVGDIQPKRSRVIHLWCSADMSDFHFGPLKNKLIRISADELDSVRRRFPMPQYLWKKYQFRLLWLFNILAYVGLAISLGWDWIRYR
jgi:hypothetical protein